MTTLKQILERQEKENLEKFAEQEHTRWSNWQAWVHKNLTYSEIKSANKTIAGYLLPADNFERWQRQIDTSYTELSEEEKDKDRREVKPYLDKFLQDKLELLEAVVGMINSLELSCIDKPTMKAEIVEFYEDAVRRTREVLLEFINAQIKELSK